MLTSEQPTADLDWMTLFTMIDLRLVRPLPFLCLPLLFHGSISFGSGRLDSAYREPLHQPPTPSLHRFSRGYTNDFFDKMFTSALTL